MAFQFNNANPRAAYERNEFGRLQSQTIYFWGEIIGWASNHLACHPQHLLPLLLHHFAADDKSGKIRVVHDN